MENLKKNSLALAIIVAALIIGGVYFYTNKSSAGSLSAQEAADKAITFINQSIEEGLTASLLDVSEEKGLNYQLYRVHLEIAGTEYNSYITKDGKLLFPNVFNLEEQVIEELEETSVEPGALDNFAQCLSAAGMKFYGSEYCGWCSQQKDLFGDSFQYIAYVDCVDPQTEQWSQECVAEEIDATPTWLVPSGEKSAGYKSLEQLSEISGCPIE